MPCWHLRWGLPGVAGCVSLQGPIRGEVHTEDARAVQDVVVRLYCHAPAFHGHTKSDDERTTLRAGERFLFPFSFRLLWGNRCSVTAISWP